MVALSVHYARDEHPCITLTSFSKEEVTVFSVNAMTDLLGYSEQAIYKQARRQALLYRKLGRKVIFLRQEVEAYLHGLPGLELRHISL